MHRFFCWIGLHALVEESRSVGPACIIGVFGIINVSDATHVIDRCRHCHKRWRALVIPPGQRRDFRELIGESKNGKSL